MNWCEASEWLDCVSLPHVRRKFSWKLYRSDCSGDNSHAIYLSGQLAGPCEVINNRILGTSHSGHALKLGCNSGLVEGNEVRMLDGRGAPPVDLVSGGGWVFRDNLFQSGPNATNSGFFNNAVAERRNRGGTWEPAVHDLLLEGNTHIVDAGLETKRCFMASKSPGSITLRGETFIGFTAENGCGQGDKLGYAAPWFDPLTDPEPTADERAPLSSYERFSEENTTWFADRAAAGRPSYEEQLQ